MPEKLPQNIEAEGFILGLMLMSKTCLVEGMGKIKEDFFHKPTYSLIFKGMYSLFVKGEEISSISLIEELKRLGTLSAIGGSMGILDLAESSISDTEFNTYYSILEDKAVKRRIIKAAYIIIQSGYEDKLEMGEYIKQSMESMWHTSPQTTSKIQIISSGGLYNERKKILKARHKTSPIKFGWKNLDNIVVSGLAPGDVSIVASRPGLGKSTLKANLILKLCEQDLGVVSFATEQGFATEQDRLESIMTEIPLTEIINSRLWQKGDYRVKLIKQANEIIDDQFNYHIIPSRSISVADARMALYTIAQKSQMHVVFFDLFDKLIDVNVSNNKAQTVGVKIGDIARIAEEFNIHICLLVQISRRVEYRADKRPLMSDLKDSGNYEEAARLVLLLYREKYYFQESLNTDMEIIVGKQSNGPLGTAVMDFNEDTLKLEEAEEHLSSVFGGQG